MVTITQAREAVEDLGNARLVAETLIAIVDEFFPPAHQPHQATNQGTTSLDRPPTQPPTPPTAKVVATI